MEQIVFNGIVTNVDRIDQKPENAQDTSLVDISTVGKLIMENVGFEKQHSAEQTNGIVSIVQLGDDTTIVAF